MMLTLVFVFFPSYSGKPGPGASEKTTGAGSSSSLSAAPTAAAIPAH